jgi:hypothetical protein
VLAINQDRLERPWLAFGLVAAALEVTIWTTVLARSRPLALLAPAPAPAALGVECVVVAIGGFAMTGLARLTAGSRLIVFKVTPLANGLLFVLGQLCLCGASRTCGGRDNHAVTLTLAAFGSSDQSSGRNASSTCCAAAVGVTSPAATFASRPGTKAATSASPRSDSTSVSETSDHNHCRA